jgi:hypothetical protein
VRVHRPGRWMTVTIPPSTPQRVTLHGVRYRVFRGLTAQDRPPNNNNVSDRFAGAGEKKKDSPPTIGRTFACRRAGLGNVRTAYTCRRGHGTSARKTRARGGVVPLWVGRGRRCSRPLSVVRTLCGSDTLVRTKIPTHLLRYTVGRFIVRSFPVERVQKRHVRRRVYANVAMYTMTRARICMLRKPWHHKICTCALIL